jgi:signal transduction histidine kinase
MLVNIIVMEYTPQIAAKAQQLTVVAPDGLPAILCDTLRASQILSNLISNATKYTAKGGSISITVQHAPDEGFLLVIVRDDGVGIPSSEHKKIFERFFRASSAMLAGVAGAGLGLHIVRALVELHGGRIWLESEIGQGTTFYVTFPLADMPAVSNRVDPPGRFPRIR